MLQPYWTRRRGERGERAMLNRFPPEKSVRLRFATSRASRVLPLGTDRGQAFVLSAVLMVALIGATGLAIDFGVASVRHRSAQKAADAAALAGAQQLPGLAADAASAAVTQA